MKLETGKWYWIKRTIDRTPTPALYSGPPAPFFLCQGQRYTIDVEVWGEIGSPPNEPPFEPGWYWCRHRLGNWTLLHLNDRNIHSEWEIGDRVEVPEKYKRNFTTPNGGNIRL